MTGSGFFVSPDGHVVTAAHVVQSCGQIRVRTDDAAYKLARLLAISEQHDLALLKTLGEVPATAVLRHQHRPDQTSAWVFGYPANGTPVRAHVTVARVQPREAGDGPATLRLHANITGGYSGGPVMDSTGGVIGMVQGAYAERTDTIVALAAVPLIEFVQRYSVPYRSDVERAPNSPAVFRLGRAITARIECN